MGAEIEAGKDAEKETGKDAEMEACKDAEMEGGIALKCGVCCLRYCQSGVQQMLIVKASCIGWVLG